MSHGCLPFGYDGQRSARHPHYLSDAATFMPERGDARPARRRGRERNALSTRRGRVNRAFYNSA